MVASIENGFRSTTITSTKGITYTVILCIYDVSKVGRVNSPSQMGTWWHMGMYCYRQNHQPKPSPSEPPCKWDESEDLENPGGCDMMWSKILLHGCWDGKLWMSQDKRLHMAHSLWIVWWNMRIQPTTPNQNTSYSRLFEWFLVVFEPLIMPSHIIILHSRGEIADHFHPHVMSSGDTHHWSHCCPEMGYYIKIATYPPAKLGVPENLSLTSMILAAINPNWSEFFHCHLSRGTWTSCHSCSAPFHCVPGNMQRTLGGLGFISPRSRGLYIEGN